VTIYKAGQSFFEVPGDRHGVSANASKMQPAKLLAVFVVDTNAADLTTPTRTSRLVSRRSGLRQVALSISCLSPTITRPDAFSHCASI
jgi:hypothetical protein